MEEEVVVVEERNHPLMVFMPNKGGSEANRGSFSFSVVVGWVGGRIAGIIELISKSRK